MAFTKPVVVIDNGSYNVKAGFACDNHPVSIFRNVVGRPKYLKGSYGRSHYDVYIGDEAIAKYQELDLNFPVVGGRIVHWDNMERVWHHVFYRELKAAPEDRSVMLSCAPPTSMKDKVKCCEIFFETLNVPALCMKPQSILALFGSGYTTGLSVDFGYDITEVNPVYEGGPITYANMLTNVGGRQIDKFITERLENRGLLLGKDSDKIVSDIRNKCSYVTENCAVTRTEYQRTYTLPNGEQLDVSEEAFMSGELLFQPDLVMGRKTDYAPIHKAIVETVMKCDKDLQSDIFDAIVIHGGVGVLPGLNKRLQKEIEAITKKPVILVNSTEACAVPWLGGATFAGLPDAQKVWVDRKIFDEHGERIVRNRF